jgi:hypothetical protein
LLKGSITVGLRQHQIKTTWNIKEETGKLHLAEQKPSLLINDEVKDPEVTAEPFNFFFSDSY